MTRLRDIETGKMSQKTQIYKYVSSTVISKNGVPNNSCCYDTMQNTINDVVMHFSETLSCFNADLKLIQSFSR